jgi:site-specific DNA-methyltransferase (adenine-specific)
MKSGISIIHGDCIEVMRNWEHERPALIFADPPYNLGVDYGAGAKADRMSIVEFHKWSWRWIIALVGVVAPGGSVWVLTNAEWATYYSNCLGDLFVSRNWIIWHETFGNYTQANFAQDHRHLFYHVKPGAPHIWNPDAIRVPSDRQTKYNDKRANPKGRVPGNVWKFSRLCGTFKERVDWHPAQLPSALLERIILSTSNPGDLVVDIFSGSGSMGVVCKKHGRRFIGIELNEEYVVKSRARIAEAPCGEGSD